jgi:hypothetical protein
MRSTRRGGVAILISLAILLAFEAAPATALTLQRTWSTRLGSSGSNGTVTLSAYTSGAGSIRYGIRGLRANTTYSVQIRNGTCARLGSVAARLAAIRTSATGTAARVDPLSSGTMYWIWRAARTPSFVVRFVSGTSIRCGDFSFAHATRVAVPGFGIDLPVIRGTSGYPPCRVALYLASVAQPREPGVSFIFAHARTGMFLPLLTSWRNNRGASLIGRTVMVWTSDSYVSYYRVVRVRVASNAMSGANTTYPKLIVEASRYKTARATSAASHPTPHPVRC